MMWLIVIGTQPTFWLFKATVDGGELRMHASLFSAAHHFQSVQMSDVCKLWGSSPSPSSLSFACCTERAGERRLYDLRRRRRTSERENEEDERDLKVSHSATKVKDGFPPKWTDLSFQSIPLILVHDAFILHAEIYRRNIFMSWTLAFNPNLCTC